MDIDQGAELLGLTRDELAQIEAGDVRASASFLFDACKIYGRPVSYLFQVPGEDGDSLGRDAARGAH